MLRKLGYIEKLILITANNVRDRYEMTDVYYILYFCALVSNRTVDTVAAGTIDLYMYMVGRTL